MAINTGNVMVGVATIYVADFGLAAAGDPEPPPADSVALGAAWGGNWAALGATEQGLKLTYNPKTVDITVEEQMTPALVTVDSVDISLACSLAEDTLANMKLAYGGAGSLVADAASGTDVGKSVLTLADTLGLFSIGFEGVNPYGFWRRAYFPKCVSVTSVATEYRRAKEARLYPTMFRVISDPSAIVITDMTAVET